MLKRHKVIIAVGIALSIITISVVSLLSNELQLLFEVTKLQQSTESIAIHIVIANHTNKRIGPFDISDSQDTISVHVNQIEPFSITDVYYKKSESWGENSINMTDNNGQQYSLVPYFENGQSGRVDIHVECITPITGLSGKKRNLVSWYFSFEWYSWGTFPCK